MPLNSTVEALDRLVPVIMTRDPTAPLPGVKPVMVGPAAGVTVKFVELVAEPKGVVTTRGPVRAVGGTSARSCVGESNCVSATTPPLKLTLLPGVKLVPVITTVAPGAPLVLKKPVIVGAGTVLIVKLPLLEATPPGEMTVTGPVVAPGGTIAKTKVVEATLKNDACTPLNCTAVRPARLVPVMATV